MIAGAAHGQTITGKVRDASLTPIQTFGAQNLQVFIESWEIDYSDTVNVDANGAYSFQNLPSANDYQVSVWVQNLNGCDGDFFYALPPDKTIGVDAPISSAIYYLQATPLSVDALTNYTNIDIIIDETQPRQVRGTVLSETDLPLSGFDISVWAEDVDFSGWASTRTDGTYTVCGVPALESLVVKAEPPNAQTLYFGEFYNNQPTYDTATRVSTIETDLEFIDFLLTSAPDNSVQGVVFDSSGNPLGDQSVFIYSESLDFSKSTTTNASGEYTVSGLKPADDYRISAYHNLGGVDYDFYYFDANRSVIVYEQATPLTVTESTLLTNIDIHIDLESGESISGTVFNKDGTEGIPDIRVNAWSEGLQIGGEAVTDTQGNYTIWGLTPPASSADHYIVGIQNDQFVDQFYSGVPTPDNADPVPTGRTDIDFFLETGSTLSGRVTEENLQPVVGAIVGVFSSAARFYQETPTDGEGTYFLSALPPENDYIVSVRHPEYRPQWFDGNPMETDADPLDLTQGTAVVDFTLSKGEIIRGTLYLDDGTTPAPAGVSVEAFSETDGTGNGTETRSDGTYEILGLDPDITYVVTVYRPGRPVVHYNSTRPDGIVYSRQLATPVPPSSTGTRDMVLPPGVSLSGAVTFNGQPIKGIRVEATAFETNPDVGEIDYGWGEAITKGAIVDGANYTITGLRPGTSLAAADYTVTIYPPPELAQFAMQTKTVSVGAEDVSGVDFALSQASGRTLSGGIANLAADRTVFVNAWSESVRSGNGVEITGTGEPTVPYQITSLIPADDYVVELISPDYPRLVYEDKLGWMPPDEVDLSVDDAPNIDFTLPSLNNLVTISGAITFPETASAGDTVRVAAISAGIGVEREVDVSLSSAGLTETYTIPALLKAADYRVSVRSRQYRFQYFNGAATENDATLVDISGGSIEDIDFILGVGTAISGQVTKDGTGLSGVEVTAWSDSLGVGGFALSQSDGAYVIRGLEKAPDYVVEVNAWRRGLGSFFYNADRTVQTRPLATRVSTESSDQAGIDITVIQGASIGGTVRSIDGEGLEGIRMSAWSNLLMAGNSAVTGSDGGYTILGLPAGAYEVSAEPDWTTGYRGKSRSDIQTGRTDVDFALTRRPGSHRLTGVITDGTNGVSGIIIEFWAPDGTLAGWDVTDKDGNWGIDGMATGTYRATATPPPGSDLAFRENHGVLVEGDRTLPNIVMDPGIRITGAVKGSDGAPIQGASVHAVSINSGYWEKTVTNASGVFRFQNVPAASDTVLTASKNGYVPKAVSGFDPTGSIQLTLFPSGAIEGEVRDVDGTPLPDVSVVATSAARKGEPAFTGGTRTDGDGRFRIDGLRRTDAQGTVITDYIVGVAAFTRYSATGEPLRYLSAVQTGRRTGETLALLVTRATDSAVEISGAVSNLNLLNDFFGSPGNYYVAVDLVAGSNTAGRFDQHQVIGDNGAFRFRGLEPGVAYFLGFGVYTGDNEPASYQWAGDTGALGDPASHEPPPGASAFEVDGPAADFSFSENLLKRRRRSDTGGPGPVRNLRLDISGLTPTGDPSVLQARSKPQDLSRNPSAAVSNSPTVTVTWLPSENGADERYYYTFNQDGTHEINKRNAPSPSVTARKATSRDLSGDYNQHHFHIAVEDDRGRLGDTSSLSFIIDTVAPRNVNVRAAPDTNAENTQVVTLELGATGATEVYISDTRFGEGGQWETFEATKQWAISGDADSATIYIQFRDEAQNTANALVEVDLIDRLGGAISTLQVMVGIVAEGMDADENGRVELSDAVLLLQQAAGVR